MTPTRAREAGVWAGNFYRPKGLAPSRLRTYFTVSERVEIGKALEGELQGRVGNPELRPIGEKIPELPQGRTRDLAAKAAGFGNGKTYATRLHSSSISRPALLMLMTVAML